MYKQATFNKTSPQFKAMRKARNKRWLHNVKWTLFFVALALLLSVDLEPLFAALGL